MPWYWGSILPLPPPSPPPFPSFCPPQSSWLAFWQEQKVKALAWAVFHFSKQIFAKTRQFDHSKYNISIHRLAKTRFRPTNSAPIYTHLHPNTNSDEQSDYANYLQDLLSFCVGRWRNIGWETAHLANPGNALHWQAVIQITSQHWS